MTPQNAQGLDPHSALNGSLPGLEGLGGTYGRLEEARRALKARAEGALDSSGGTARFGSAARVPSAEDLYRNLAPWPAIDRVPIVIGQNLTLAYVTATMRLAAQGWRYQFIDVFSELLEHDPHSRGVFRQRVCPVAGATLEVKPAFVPKTAPKGDHEKAKEIAAEVEFQLENIPARSQSLAALTWGSALGLTGAEIMWRQSSREGVKWEARSLNFIHSRRLNVPRIDSWDVNVWDQGLVGPGFGHGSPTNGPYGLRCADFPGKFVLHTPQQGFDYFTRDGEARHVATYMLLKRMCVRASAQDFERTIRPWVVGTFKRDALAEDNDQSFAVGKDIQFLQQAVQALGNGSLNTAVLSDACKVEILRAASTYPLDEFLAFLDDAIAKAVLGQTYTTSPGAHGNHAVAEVAQECMLDVLRYDARCLADSLERDLVYWMVRLNWPGLEDQFCPRLVLNVDEETTPKELMELASAATKIDIPVDARDVAERCGLKFVDVGAEDYDPTKTPRTRLVQSGGNSGPVNPTGANDPNQVGDEAAAAAAAEQAGKAPPGPDEKPGQAPKKKGSRTPSKPEEPAGKKPANDDTPPKKEQDDS